jgi:cytochrome c oxidase cbb3-type subunit I/II
VLQYPGFVDTVNAIRPFYWIRLTGGTMYLVGTLLLGWNLWRTARPDAVARVVEAA